MPVAHPPLSRFPLTKFRFGKLVGGLHRLNLPQKIVQNDSSLLGLIYPSGDGQRCLTA